jgi:hypothetical protein
MVVWESAWVGVNKTLYLIVPEVAYILYVHIYCVILLLEIWDLKLLNPAISIFCLSC